MSTVPGRDSLRDAGLVDPLPVDGEDVPEPPEADEAEPEEYTPEDPMPAQKPDVNPADVVDQAVEVPEDETDDYR